MTKLNLLLLGALIASAIYQVQVAHDARLVFTQLDRAQAEMRLLDTERVRLTAEKQAQATPYLVEKAARERLAMRTATPAVTQYVGAPEGGAVGAAATAAASVATATAAAAASPGSAPKEDRKP